MYKAGRKQFFFLVVCLGLIFFSDCGPVDIQYEKENDKRKDFNSLFLSFRKNIFCIFVMDTKFDFGTAFFFFSFEKQMICLLNILNWAGPVVMETRRGRARARATH